MYDTGVRNGRGIRAWSWVNSSPLFAAYERNRLFVYREMEKGPRTSWPDG